MRQFVRADTDATLREVQRWLGATHNVRFSRPALSRLLTKLDLPRKKRRDRCRYLSNCCGAIPRPALVPGDIVVWDDLSVHKTPELKTRIEAEQATDKYPIALGLQDFFGITVRIWELNGFDKAALVDVALKLSGSWRVLVHICTTPPAFLPLYQRLCGRRGGPTPPRRLTSVPATHPFDEDPEHLAVGSANHEHRRTDPALVQRG